MQITLKLKCGPIFSIQNAQAAQPSSSLLNCMFRLVMTEYKIMGTVIHVH